MRQAGDALALQQADPPTKSSGAGQRVAAARVLLLRRLCCAGSIHLLLPDTKHTMQFLEAHVPHARDRR